VNGLEKRNPNVRQGHQTMHHMALQHIRNLTTNVTKGVRAPVLLVGLEANKNPRDLYPQSKKIFKEQKFQDRKAKEYSKN